MNLSVAGDSDDQALLIGAARADQTGADGVPTEIDQRGDYVFTGDVAELSNAGSIAIGRWNNGTVTTPSGPDFALDANQGWHFVYNTVQAPDLPIFATFYYDLLSATAPTFAGGGSAPGTFDADLAIAYASGRLSVGIDGTVTMPRAGDPLIYSFSTGDLTDRATFVSTARPSSSPFTGNVFNFTVQSTDSAGSCKRSTCPIYFNMTVGKDAGNVGLNYLVQPLGGDPQNQIRGAALFGRVDNPALAPITSFDPVRGNLIYARAFATSPTAGDVRSDAVAEMEYTLDTDGSLQTASKTVGSNTTRFDQGTRSTFEFYGDNNFLMGRWGDGAVGGSNYSANQGFHYVFARPIRADFALPTSGVVNYRVLQATAPTYADGRVAPGVFDAQMAIDLGTLRIGIEGVIAMAGQRFATDYFNFASDGGIAEPSERLSILADGSFSFSADARSSTAEFCAACNLSFRGQFAGSSPDQVGLTYLMQPRPGVGSRADTIAGAAIMSTTAPARDPIGPTPPSQTGAPSVTQFYDVLSSVRRGAGGSAQRTSAIVDLDGRIEYINGSLSSSDLDAGNSTALQYGRYGNVVAWSRYRTDDNRYSNGNLHAIVGLPYTPITQRGTIDYKLIGGTAPTDLNGPAGETGIFTGAFSVTVSGQPRYQLNGRIQLGGRDLTFATQGSGGSIAADGTFNNQSLRIRLNGQQGVSGNVAGSLFGDQGAFAGFTYYFDGPRGDDFLITGSAIFGQQGTELAQIDNTTVVGAQTIPDAQSASLSAASRVAEVAVRSIEPAGPTGVDQPDGAPFADPRASRWFTAAAGPAAVATSQGMDALGTAGWGRWMAPSPGGTVAAPLRIELPSALPSGALVSLGTGASGRLNQMISFDMPERR